jgi:hypothetical protein
MTVVETALVYGAIPLGITLLLALFVFGRSAMQQPNRYRPGRAWTYQPVWFVPHPEALPHHESARLAIEGAIDGSGRTSAVGGASGEW